jgi:hypothetical protein
MDASSKLKNSKVDKFWLLKRSRPRDYNDANLNKKSILSNRTITQPFQPVKQLAIEIK